MSKFCTNCGNPLPDGAKYCPECSEPAPIEIKAPKGAEITISDEPPEELSQDPRSSKAHKTSAAAEGPAKSSNTEKSTKTAPKKRGLSLFLVIVMLFELGVAAFKYPGFLAKGQDDPLSGLFSCAQNGNISGNTAEDEWLPSPVSEISVTFTDKEIAGAPKHEAAVSTDNLQATCGDVTADFCNSWNLTGEDTLIVRDLPRKEDKNAGYVLLGYDVSLASGQDEFPTYVKITIPRTATSENDGFCATYNEETGKFERLYYEISEDGKSYIIYTDHFSRKFEVRYTEAVIKRIKKIIEEGDKMNEALASYLSGIFGYQMNDRALFEKDVMNLPVTADLYNLFRRRTYDGTLTMDQMLALAEIVKEGDLGLVLPLSDDLFAANDTAGAQLSLLSALTSGREIITKNKLSAIPEGMGKLAGGINAIISLIGTLNKMTKDISNGSGVGEAVLNNKLGVIGTSIGVAGVLVSSATATFILAIAGLGCWAVSKAYDSVAPRDIDTMERNYRDYFAPVNGVPRNFRYDLPLDEDSRKNNVDSIRVLENLNDAQNRELKKLINEKLAALPGVSPLGGSPKDPVPYEWAAVMRKIYELCEDDPESLTDTITEFLRNYASCFSYHDGINDPIYYQYIDEFMTNRGDKHDRVVPTKLEQDNHISYLMHDMMGWFTDLQWELMLTYEYQTKVEVATLIEQELLPLLNTKIVFTLEDTALGSKQSLTDSIYNVPYKIDEDYTLEGKISDYASNTFPNLIKAEAPMRFLVGTDGDYQEVERPVLEPKAWFSYSKELHDVGVFSTARSTHYYPYVDNFLPKITNNSSEIFSCTVYHYLLMGAPRAIRFHDMEGDIKDQDIPFKLSAPGSDGVIRVNIKVKGTQRDYRGKSVKCDFFARSVDRTLENDPVISEMYTEMIQGIDLAFKDDGTFYASGSITKDVKEKGISNSVEPVGQISLGNPNGSSSGNTSTPDPSKIDYAWKGTATVSFTLTSTVDEKTGKKTANVSGTVFIHLKYVRDDKYGKTEYDYNATFEGSTDMFITIEQEDGTEILRFVFYRDGAGKEGKTSLKSNLTIDSKYFDSYYKDRPPHEEFKDMFIQFTIDFVRVKKPS